MSIKDKQTEKLLDSAEMLDKSVKDWERRMVDWERKVDILPFNHSIDDLKKLEMELSTLIARGEMEIRNLENWEQERIKLWQKKN